MVNNDGGGFGYIYIFPLWILNKITYFYLSHRIILPKVPICRKGSVKGVSCKVIQLVI